MFKSSRIQSIVISAVLVAGCVDTPVSIGTPEATPDPLRAAVLSMGFRPDMIVDAGQEFVISGDISISKERLRQQLAENPAAFQKQYPQLVGTQAVQGITVDLSGLDAAWAAAARAPSMSGTQ